MFWWVFLARADVRVVFPPFCCAVARLDSFECEACLLNFFFNACNWGVGAEGSSPLPLTLVSGEIPLLACNWVAVGHVGGGTAE